MKYQAIDSDYIREMKEYDEFMRDKKLLYKGMKYGYFVAIFIIIISAFFNGNLVLAQTSNIEYDFENGYAYNGVLPESAITDNQRYITEPNGHYPATFSFENDTGDPDGWNVIETAGAVDIIDSENGHSKVLKIEDTDGSDGITISKTMLDATQHGTIEFWWLFNDTSKIGYYQVSLEGIKIFYFGVFADKFQYSDSSGWHDVGLGALNNTWYRISVNYESSNSGYKGLSQYQWNVYIDDVEYGDFSFWTNVDTITYIQEYFFTYTFDFDYYMLVDAIGYSWDITSVGEYNLTDIVMNTGTYSGDFNDANIDDGNYFTMNSELEYGIPFIRADFIFNNSLPSELINISYHMEGTINVFIEANYEYFDYGLTIDDNVMINDVNSISIIMTQVGADFEVDIFYIHIEEFVPNYRIGENRYEGYGATNQTETDRFEFTYDISGNINLDGDDNVSGFTDIENDYFDNDVVNIVDSIDDGIDKAIRISSAQKGYCGITRDFNHDYANTSEIWWQLDLTHFGYPDSEIYTNIENNDGDVIAKFKLNGSYAPLVPPIHSKVADLSYYNGSDYILIESGIGYLNNYNMTFNLNWTDGTNFGDLSFNGNEYYIPFFNDQDSLGNFEIYGINDNNIVFNNLDFQIDWIRININGTTLCDEIMPDNFYLLSSDDFSLLTQSFIEITFDITFDNNVSIWLNDDIEIFNNSGETSIFGNFFQDKSYSHLFLRIYNYSTYHILDIKIYGIKIVNQVDSTDYAFLEFVYSEVDANESYFYVSGNDLYYSLETDDNSKLEYIQATFNIPDLNCEGFGIGFSHQKSTTYIISESRIIFTSGSYLSFFSIDAVKAESLILPQDKTIREITFLISDNNDNILDTSTGYFSSITLIYYPDIETTITTLSLIEIIPLLILFTLIPVVIYYGFGKRKELVVPSIALVSIFATGVGMFPLWAEVIVIFSLIVYYAVRSKGGI